MPGLRVEIPKGTFCGSVSETAVEGHMRESKSQSWSAFVRPKPSLISSVTDWINAFSSQAKIVNNQNKNY